MYLTWYIRWMPFIFCHVWLAPQPPFCPMTYHDNPMNPAVRIPFELALNIPTCVLIVIVAICSRSSSRSSSSSSSRNI